MTFNPKVGDVFLKRYEIVSRVGEGAFGSVYRARDAKLDRVVAIKFINIAGGTIDRFTDELDAIKSLDHPNIVRLYDYDILRGGIPCIAMEFVNGREIGDILAEQGPFELVQICEIAQQILDALVETHKHGIIHCDLKPENIMLTSVGARKNVVKLIDFGVANLLTKTKDGEARSNLLVGTPQYMAPEQITHAAIGPWTDIYSIGLILIELFTGNFVFDHDDPREVLRMQLNSPVVLPHRLAITELGPIISKATEKDVAKRYHSTQQFYDDVSAALHAMRSINSQQPFRKRLDSSPGRNRAISSVFDDINDFSFSPEMRVNANSMSTKTQVHNSDIFLNVPLAQEALPNASNGVAHPRPKTSTPVMPTLTSSLINRNNFIDENEETRLAPGPSAMVVPQLGKPARESADAANFSVPLMSNNNLDQTVSPIAPALVLDNTNKAPELRLENTKAPELKLDETNKAPEFVLDNSFKAPELKLDTTKAPELSFAEPAKTKSAEPELSFDSLGLDSLNKSLENLELETEILKDTSVKTNTGNLSEPENKTISPKPSSPSSVDIKNVTKIKYAPEPKKKSGAPLVICILLFILLIGFGAAYYCYRSGYFDNTLNNAGITTPRTAVEKAPAPKEPSIEKRQTVRFSTISETAKDMAYHAAILGHYGAQKKVSYVTYRVIGTPTDAAIYVNGAKMCARTPCSINVFGDTSKTKIMIKKGRQEKSIPLKGNSPDAPLIMVLSN